MDTPMPFLKIGEHVFQGAIAPLIGDEVIFEVVRREQPPPIPSPSINPTNLPPQMRMTHSAPTTGQHTRPRTASSYTPWA